MADFYYMRADEAVSAYAGVSQASVAATYFAEWLCDMRAGRPLQLSVTSLAAAITPLAAGEVGIVAVCHHLLDASKNIVFTGDISTTLTTASTIPPDGIRYNPWKAITPVAGVDNVTATISGNSVNIIIGEIMFGKRRSLPLPPYMQDGLDEADFSRPPDMDLSSLPGYDPALEGRIWKPRCILTAAQLAEVVLIRKAQRNKTRPTLVVPNISDGGVDAWVCFLEAIKWSPKEPGLYDVDMTFTEVPRVRWP